MKKTGDIGEIIAIKYLQKHEFQICDTNFKFGRFGEVDIIAQKNDRTYFIEVKYRSHLGYGFPEEAVSKHKLRKCLKTMQYYCVKYSLCFENIQFDIISILKKKSSYGITHYKNIEI